MKYPQEFIEARKFLDRAMSNLRNPQGVEFDFRDSYTKAVENIGKASAQLTIALTNFMREQRSGK